MQNLSLALALARSPSLFHNMRRILFLLLVYSYTF